jgi:hypothetical protein
MPAIFQASCAACGHKTTAFADEWLAVQLPSGPIEALPHPIERASLANHGLTWERAQNENRLLPRVHAICGDCGAVQELDRALARQDAHGSWWPTVALAAVALAAAVVPFVAYDMEWYWTLLVVPGTVIISLAGALWVRSRIGDYAQSWRKWRGQPKRFKALPPAAARCKSCGTGWLYHPIYVIERPFPCPGCNARALSYAMAGVS